MTVTPEQLIRNLADSPLYPYPRAIISEMIDRKEEIIPALLHILEDACQRPDYYLEDGTWKPLTFACFLLAQFRETRAFKLICSLLSLPEKKTENIFGDTITENMGSILASVYDGNDQPLRDLVENRKVDDFVRGAAIPRCYLCLIHAGRFEKHALETYVEELLGKRLERVQSFVWDGFTSLCADLGFARLVPLITKAFEEGLCDPMFYGFKNLVEAAQSGGKSEQWKRRATLINDTIKETEWWHCFQKPTASPCQPKTISSMSKVNSYQSPKIGRNDPCPCASGLKYKKCCGRA